MAKKQFNKKRSKPGDSKWQPSQDQVSEAVADFLNKGGQVNRLEAEQEPDFAPIYRSTGQSLVDVVNTSV